MTGGAVAARLAAQSGSRSAAAVVVSLATVPPAAGIV
jgi:hypothetical protein